MHGHSFFSPPYLKFQSLRLLSCGYCEEWPEHRPWSLVRHLPFWTQHHFKYLLPPGLDFLKVRILSIQILLSANLLKPCNPLLDQSALTFQPCSYQSTVPHGIMPARTIHQSLVAFALVPTYHHVYQSPTVIFCCMLGMDVKSPATLNRILNNLNI